MGRRKAHKIKIREERLDTLDELKMSVAVWLLAKGRVEDRTKRIQPSPPESENNEVKRPDEQETAS
jgi:hypothetical protein